MEHLYIFSIFLYGHLYYIHMHTYIYNDEHIYGIEKERYRKGLIKDIALLDYGS